MYERPRGRIHKRPATPKDRELVVVEPTDRYDPGKVV